jgi:mono/diheme cytochrome c family protein
MARKMRAAMVPSKGVARAVFGSIAALFLLAGTAGADEPTCPDRADYLRYCSACHGEAADGNGPVADHLTPRPPALTSLRKKFGTPLSTRLVVFLSGTSMPRAHGTSDMPVWGKVLREGTGDDLGAIDLLWRIVNYLDCVQSESSAEDGEGGSPSPGDGGRPHRSRSD